ncbi:MAG: dTDP-glucose 4,6-dehydratase [Fimbriimonas ginsengisoli]|uniref:dTDP-glucose 4,6-dehydratase n=1 Tax=Fimbriimonas ginsengisoli TaxID=1005039 RepID=A0A931PUX9_FIMGI|nr:dTDP-glucose 4,6-dehydratase [Fimbriimonas ginsengisoli]
MNLLVCGGAGFIGSNFVRLMLEREPGCRIAILDALTYAGNMTTIADVLADPRCRFTHGQIQDAHTVAELVKAKKITHIVNFAAETHNDRSLLESGSFIQTDVFGVHVLLEATRKFGLERLVHVSTDEVYGSIAEGRFTEQSPLEPNTPYSASKAGGDLQARAHFVSFGTPVIVTRGGNNYGPFQYPEKLIPFFVTRLMDGKKVPLYGDGSQVREWIHVMDHCEGIEKVLRKGEPGQVYNIGDDNERANHEVVRILLEETGRDAALVKSIPDPRRGAHDKRYSMACDRVRALGWMPRRSFHEHLRETVRWYREHEAWWRPIAESEAYESFVKAFYGPSLGEDL